MRHKITFNESKWTLLIESWSMIECINKLPMVIQIWNRSLKWDKVTSLSLSLTFRICRPPFPITINQNSINASNKEKVVHIDHQRSYIIVERNTTRVVKELCYRDRRHTYWDINYKPFFITRSTKSTTTITYNQGYPWIFYVHDWVVKTKYRLSTYRNGQHLTQVRLFYQFFSGKVLKPFLGERERDYRKHEL